MGAVELDVDVAESDGSTIVSLRGEVDVYTAPGLKDRLRSVAAEPGRHIVIDLARVGFLDSTGLGALVGGLEQARESGSTMVLACTQERILKLFDITGLADVFDIRPTVDDAIPS